MVDCAQQVGCSHDHQLIANCLDFLDTEAQVNLFGFSPNILFFLSTLFHFIVNQTKESQPECIHGFTMNVASNGKQASDRKDYIASVYSSLAQNHETDGEASLSITSNIRKFIEGKVDISAKNSLPSNSKSLDIDHFVDVTEEMDANPSTIDVKRCKTV